MTLLTGLVAAIAYCSWPLGLLLNPTLARSALASDLEAHSQPFSWLFILLDCVTGIAALVVASRTWPGSKQDRLTRVAVLGYALFGVATAVDALIPLNCGSSSLLSCGADLAELNVDDLLTGVALFALFLAAVCVQVPALQERSWILPLVGSAAVVLIWSGCGLAFFAAHFSNRPAVGLQHLMLTLTSAMALAVPGVIVLAERRVGSSRVRRPDVIARPICRPPAEFQPSDPSAGLRAGRFSRSRLHR